MLTIPRKKPRKLDDFQSNGWLDAIKSSSPPSKKILKNCNVEVSLDDSDIRYCFWMLRYPSALNSFEKIITRVRNKQMVMFLDYDGTLSPIVDDPDLVFMSDEVYDLVGLTELYYASNHGMDIMCPVKDSVSAKTSNCIKFTDQ
ncbi:probable trehalose-phosphate phosphatase G [Camellia sinensis]|uniref:probable trehalose-phosphate phosphatase G n=1 Tax=Camellia sinensis TaxID=4442 RepID=UPI001035E9D7|nr:probable trehalose-phosphate phosphatase G [Camellia sinensis]